MDACVAIMNDRDGNICKDLLPKITCPTLIVHGEKDALVAPEHPQYLKESIKGSRYVHFFPIENLHLKSSMVFPRFCNWIRFLNVQVFGVSF